MHFIREKAILGRKINKYELIHIVVNKNARTIAQFIPPPPQTKYTNKQQMCMKKRVKKDVYRQNLYHGIYV